MAQQRRTGYRGEKIVYDYLKKKLLPWSYENWTSRFRSYAGFPRLKGPEATQADFTYTDYCLTMRRLMKDLGVPVYREAWNEYTTYHIEVKTSGGMSNRSFRMSENQYNIMQDRDRPGEVYMILLISDLNAPKHTIEVLLHPWKLVQQNQLILKFPSDAQFETFNNRRVKGWRLNLEVRKRRGYQGYVAKSWQPPYPVEQMGKDDLSLIAESLDYGNLDNVRDFDVDDDILDEC